VLDLQRKARSAPAAVGREGVDRPNLGEDRHLRRRERGAHGVS
jgi:hypothetical protein